MSGINGDKSRFNRLRKQKLARRKRNQEQFKALAPQGISPQVPAMNEGKTRTA